MAEVITKELKTKKHKFGVIAGKSADLSPEQLEGILKRRAITLARSPENEYKSGEIIQLVTFSLGQEDYGINISLIQEIQPLRDLTLIPCTPNFVIGAVNIRGKIISIIDISKLFNLTHESCSASAKVMVVKWKDLELGILADEVSDVVSANQSDIKPPLATLSGTREEYIKGEYIFKDSKKMLVILDVENILKDKRMIIHEEVG